VIWSLGNDIWEVLGGKWAYIGILDSDGWNCKQKDKWRINICIYCNEVEVDWTGIGLSGERCWKTRNCYSSTTIIVAIVAINILIKAVTSSVIKVVTSSLIIAI
jgi:hypothetical protein